MSFQVEQIDHVEVTVPDRYEAAVWYESVLGMKILADFEFWAEASGGPLMIGTPKGGTKLALFEGNSHGSQRGTGFHLTAFRVTGEHFVLFLDRLASLNLRDQHGNSVSRHDAVDHQKAYSIYFCDPWSNQLEITTYDFQMVKEQLGN